MSRLRLTKTETRDMADRDRLSTLDLQLGTPPAWKTSTPSFFTAFVVITAVLAVFALVVR
jgi:hypothetical protein